MLECIEKGDEHLSCYIGVARNILSAYAIPSCIGTSPYNFPSPDEVCGTIADMLPAPSAMCTDDFYSGPIFPLKILLNVAQLYGFAKFDHYFNEAQIFTSYQRSQKSITNEMWLLLYDGLRADLSAFRDR